MPVDTKQIMDAAESLGKLLAQHPAVEKYKSAQKAVTEDAEASRLLAEFDRQIEALGRLEQSGRPITDAQRMQLESIQSRLVSNIKVKAWNMAQVEFVDLLRKVGQTYQRPLADAAPPAGGGGGGGPKLTMPRPS
jgi:cell fate (sporulation/competence/biofilm development) regulator YlbF (YheA/YmcA/DUF963 family)